MHPPHPSPPLPPRSSSVHGTAEQRPGTTRRRLKIMPSPSDGLSAAHARAWPLTTSMMWWHGADVRRSAPHAHALMTPLMTQSTGGDHPTRQQLGSPGARGAPLTARAQRGAPGVTDGWCINTQPVRIRAAGSDSQVSTEGSAPGWLGADSGPAPGHPAKKPTDLNAARKRLKPVQI